MTPAVGGTIFGRAVPVHANSISVVTTIKKEVRIERYPVPSTQFTAKSNHLPIAQDTETSESIVLKPDGDGEQNSRDHRTCTPPPKETACWRI